MIAQDIGSYIHGELGRTPEVITAAAGNDNTEVNGPAIDMLALAGQGKRSAKSAKVLIAYDTTLTAAKTLTLNANLQTSSVSNFASDTADIGTAPTAKVVTATGKGVWEFDVDLTNIKQYVRLQSTADLSHTGTDTVAISGVIVLGGFDQLPVA